MLRTGFIERDDRDGRDDRDDRENRENKEFREFRERLSLISLSSLISLNSLIDHLNQRTNFLLEGIRYNARRISRRWAVLEVLPIDEIIR